MENSYPERSGFMGGMARVLNAGGGAAVYAYDMMSAAVGKAFIVAKRAPALPERVVGIFASGFGIVKPSETKQLKEKIEHYQRKIKALYFEIGKEGATYSGVESALETEPVKKLIAAVREYEKEIQRLQDRIVEIKEQKKAEALRRKELKKAAKLVTKRDKIADEKVEKRVESAIAKGVRRAEFESRSEREIFDKVANDLLDDEMEIKVLAAAELGKIGNDAAVPILLEAAHFDSPDLMSEIVNSLTMIGDLRAIPLLQENANHPKYRVRIGCLRGLYKLADSQEAMPMLLEALRDEHPEVRRTAVTFIGWKDYAEAMPSLVQCLRDEDARVRKAAVAAVANIKDALAVLPLINLLKDKDLEIREKAFDAIKVISGEAITFDVHASGTELSEAINNLRNWWQQERLGKVELTEAEEVAEAEEESREAKAGDERQTEIERPWAEEEADKVEAWVEEYKHTHESLMRMTKAELLSMCKERGIESDEKMTKSEISQLILEETK
jgi:HEAT repeat protein